MEKEKKEEKEVLETKPFEVVDLWIPACLVWHYESGLAKGVLQLGVGSSSPGEGSPTWGSPSVPGGVPKPEEGPKARGGVLQPGGLPA